MVHDISPDILTEDDSGDYTAKEQYILSCLSQTKQRTHDRLKPKHQIERTGDKLGHHSKEDILLSQQKALEKLNNVINSQYLDCQGNKLDIQTHNEVSNYPWYILFETFVMSFEKKKHQFVSQEKLMHV